MIKAVLWAGPIYDGGKIFDLNDPYLNRDGVQYVWWLLREEFRKHGIELVTKDQVAEKEPVAFLLCNNEFCDMPFPKKYLIILESELISPELWFNKPKHAEYSKIFNWYPLWKDDRYVQIGWPNTVLPMAPAGERRFLCQISNCQKTSPHYKELYSLRIKAAEYFGDRLHSYGPGWLNGAIDKKQSVLSQYKYAICFENAKEIPGYITEKIYDCFFAGTIPVYCGAPDITSHVPHGLFFDFKSYNYDFRRLDVALKAMGAKEHEYIISRIEQFLKTKLFASAEKFVEIVAETIVKDSQNIR